MKGYSATSVPTHTDNARDVLMQAYNDARDAGCGSLGEIADVAIMYLIKTLHLDPAYYHYVAAQTGAVKSIRDNKPELRTSKTAAQHAASKIVPKKTVKKSGKKVTIKRNKPTPLDTGI